MIYGLEELQLEFVLAEMRKSEYEFSLTGSRFFGTHNEGSDYDFFAQDSIEIRSFLSELGFESNVWVDFDPMQYNDDNMAVVFRHFGAGVDVQLQKEVEKKALAQIILQGMGIFVKPVPKYKQRALWNCAYETLSCLGRIYV